MKRKRSWGVGFSLFFILCFGAALPAAAGEPPGNAFVKAITEGTPYLDARYRFERVDDGPGRNANASTVRARFGFLTGKVHDFSARIEFEHIDTIGAEKFNSTTNGKAQFPTVADPSETEVNQLTLRYQGVPDTSVTVGRQRVILDNARFVGNVGFRQNEQTFDSAVIANTSLPDTTLIYGLVWNVNRIFGDGSPDGDFGTTTHLINVSYGGLDFIKPTAYVYLIDLTDVGRGDSSIASYGLRLTGKTAVAEGLAALYTVEFAHQTDYASSTVENSHDYYTAELGLAATKIASTFDITARIGYEVLEGDGTRAFQTPLATLYAFNGWTDKFLSTPANGIEDIYVKLGVKAYGVNFLAVYHDFGAEQGSLDHGSEWGLNISRKFFDRLTLGLKYADYNADNTSTDTEKLWLTGGVKF
jgi:hypothetical protein